MPNIVPTARYYPRLSEVITVEDLPEFLSFVQDGLNTIFDKIHYKNLQYSKSQRGDAAFYSLEIVTSKKLAIPLPFDLALVLNPDLTGHDSTISSFTITLEYQWEILAFLKSFSLDNFSFSLEDFYNVGLQVFRISDDQVLAHILNNFVEPIAPNTTKIEEVIENINTFYSFTGTNMLALPSGTEESVQALITAIKSHTGIDKTISLLLFAIYVLDSDLDTTKRNLQTFYSKIVPEGIEAYIKKLIVPKAKATLALSAAIEFPQNILKPVNEDGSAYDPDSAKTKFVFAQAQLYADTEKGIGYQLELGGSLMPPNATIGKSGLILRIESLKIDLSKKTNIIEADADGRPSDFIGVYARVIAITLPSKWFHTPAELEASMVSTLRLGGYDLLIGTGGLSGTIMLETVPVVSAGAVYPYYFDNEFALNYPVTLFQKNDVTGEITETNVADLTTLKTLLFPTGNPTTPIPPYNFKFPLSLTIGGEIKTFSAAAEYQLFLTNVNIGAANDTKMLWKNIGSDASKGFRVGFSKFDITFKQNKVLSSNIKGALEIKKFVYPASSPLAGQTVRINIEGHLHDNGDFNLTASTNPTFPIELKDVFTYDIRSLELGREDDDFYIGTAGSLQFQGFLKTTMGLGPIEIERLRIYSDGNIEFIGGGSINLPAPLVLKLGPVEITVTALHFGGHQKEINGVMRKFNYFGFDGGISVDPLGVEIRGDGVKFYYCVDNLDHKPDPYLHIQTLYLDLTIPAKSPTAIINGWISIPEPGVSKEYAGGIKIQIPKAKVSGRADMKLMPKYPAFIIDAEIEPPAPIPLGSFAIYGFSGLLGYRYVAEKEAINMVSGVNTWYEYYKAPQRGINVRKFNGPDKTKLSGTPFSIGAGASLGTSADNGTVLNIKAMVLLSIPSLFMIDGRAALLSARLGLEDTKDPPFFAFIAIGDDSLELGFGADFKMPTKNGNLLSVYADIQAGFFFKNQHPWYVNIGTKTNPVTARIIKILTIKSYVMLSAKGIEAGARGEFNFDRKYGPISVKAHAFVEVGGQISFERPQMGAYLMAGVSAHIKVLWVNIGLDVGIMFGVQSPKPFTIWGEFYFRIRIKVWRFTIFRFKGKLKVVWNINKDVDRTPLNPMSSQLNQLLAKQAALPAGAQQSQIDAIEMAIEAMNRDFVKGVNMLSNEFFELAYLDDIPLNTDWDALEKIKSYIIPLDTYIDLKTEKNLAPGDMSNPASNVRRLLGGVNNAPKGNKDLIPPVKSLKGKDFNRVTHEYTLDHIEIRFWNGLSWENYHPYEALYPHDNNITDMKIGQFQKTDGKYNTVRILATTPFSYAEQGQPGWNVPEQYGINPSTLFCSENPIEAKCANFLFKPLNAHYYCGDSNNPVFSNEVAFQLLTSNDIDYARISGETNPFNFAKSLAFENWNSMEINLPESSFQVGLKLSNFSNGVKIKYYSILQGDTITQVSGPSYCNPDPNASNIDEPYEITVSSIALNQRIEYDHTDWLGIAKIVVEPIFDSTISAQIAILSEAIAEIQNDNEMITLGIFEGEIASTELLEEQLHQLTCGAGSGNNSNVTSFVNRYHKEDKLNYIYSKEFEENNSQFIYSIGTTKRKGLISKIATNGTIIWEQKYSLDVEQPLIFNHIIQLNSFSPEQNVFQYIVHATSGDVQYLLSFNPDNGEIIWMKELDWKVKDVLVHIAPSKTEFNFYLVIAAKDSKTNIDDVYVSKIDAMGNFIKGNFLALNGKKITINSICEAVDGLVLVGGYYQSPSIHPNGIIVKIDTNLTIVNSFSMDVDYTILQSIGILDWNSSKYVVSGYDSKVNSIFTMIVSGEGSYNYYYVNNSQHQKSSIQIDSARFYLSINDDQNGSLHLLDFDFNVLWSKKIQLNSGSNGFKNFTFNRQSQKITSNCYNEIEGSLLVYTDKNLQSCLTASTDLSIILKTIAISKIVVKESKFEIKSKAIIPFNAAITSTVTEYCQATGCGEEDIAVCELYAQILEIYENCLVDPIENQNINLDTVKNCCATIYNLIKVFDVNYNLNVILDDKIDQLYEFSFNTNSTNYTIAWNAVQSILSYLNEIGNCVCECNPNNFTMLHEVCWMSVEDYQYNINIPSQDEITADANATLLGITKYIQPIWRPDTSYYVHFVLSDNVDNGYNRQPYRFTYGFTTGGPLGYFHTHDKATYGDIRLKVGDRLLKEDNSYYKVDAAGLLLENDTLFVANTNGFILEDTTGLLRDAATNMFIMNPDPQLVVPTRLKVVAHTDKYALTSLRPYIDYNRSYPNADGNLLSAKPLFYNDSEEDELYPEKNTTQINLFFNKTYATNFFRKWDNYPLSADNALDGRLKIVIKDPTEDALIINPPYLDYDDADTVYTHIPQTVQEWNIEQNPQVPFVLSQYTNLINSPNCTGIITTTIPASEYVTVKPKHLKPSKLYTAIVNNLFDVDHNHVLNPANDINEYKEVHKFVFRTSRYKDFKEQINSFHLEKEIEGETAQKDAIFKFEKAFTTDEINASFATIVGDPITGFTAQILDNLNNNYQHPYDRIFEGIMGLNPLDEPIATEVNIIKDTTTGNIIALIVKNPEPFNNPKFPLNMLKNTIEVVNDTNQYEVLYSKDNSQAIIMNANKNITENIDLKFNFKVYKDLPPFDSQGIPTDPALFYPTLKSEVLSLDLLNN